MIFSNNFLFGFGLGLGLGVLLAVIFFIVQIMMEKHYENREDKVMKNVIKYMEEK